MKKFMTPFFFLLSILLISCNTGADPKPVNEQKAESKKVSTKIRNGIELTTKGDLKVSQAFLLFEDGSLVPASNEARVNQVVNLRLIIDNGFTESNGKVEIGASEKIETNTGELLLDEKDLFKDLGEIEAERAKALTLNAVITRLDKLYDYFLVSFRVWDKKGNGEVNGSYKLYIQ
ncbi:MAG: hypothetical protein H7122_16225 [Chitinophagaceae bacterium]|nr:hypothetical protein [Chitinophagaceae bacterium]